MCIRKCKISQISTDPRCGKLRGFSGGRHKCLMYSAEIAGDEEDEEDKQKNAALSEEELAAKKGKRR